MNSQIAVFLANTGIYGDFDLHFSIYTRDQPLFDLHFSIYTRDQPLITYYLREGRWLSATSMESL